MPPAHIIDDDDELLQQVLLLSLQESQAYVSSSARELERVPSR